MTNVLNTRLSVISSKNRENLLQLVRALPYKIEIKEILFVKGRYEVWFVPPEKEEIKPINKDID